MNKLIPLLVAATLLLGACAQGNEQAPPPPLRNMTISDVVSAHGRTIVAQNGRTWSITNPACWRAAKVIA